ncbi:hypothetical protein B4O97_00025 [Marispirochaeta aestuarii]|uniref:Damage-control phosphatase ARMT1-like metal-binding domain-containing protein n=1 Tax=Marispirochaeta aestuarii TaxID=1963862 RepID=A0A1Y1S2H2_9SPIO|nr:ARMT1-like domain-containing protein [Marispirochaeta aestuarii]ORC38182.1 hypothetical protein B4O97_00025 [Marispirochaeta aestuarii]
MDRLCEVASSGFPAPGAVPKFLSPGFRELLNSADIIIGKGQGNYEALSGSGLSSGSPDQGKGYRFRRKGNGRGRFPRAYLRGKSRNPSEYGPRYLRYRRYVSSRP